MRLFGRKKGDREDAAFEEGTHEEIQAAEAEHYHPDAWAPPPEAEARVDDVLPPPEAGARVEGYAAPAPEAAARVEEVPPPPDAGARVEDVPAPAEPVSEPQPIAEAEPEPVVPPEPAPRPAAEPVITPPPEPVATPVQSVATEQSAATAGSTPAGTTAWGGAAAGSAPTPSEAGASGSGSGSLPVPLIGGDLAQRRPEVVVAAAFVGAFLVARILKRIAE